MALRLPGSSALVLALIAGCGSSATPAPPPEQGARVAPAAEGAAVRAPAPGEIDDRDQYAMALEMLAAEGEEPERHATGFAEVRGRWEGRRYRWSMGRVAGLCRQPEPCLFVPFDQSRFPHHVYYAFLAQVGFSAEAHAEMEEACRPHAGCVVTFEATLTELRLTVDDPAAITLSDARFVQARAQRDGESWGARVPRRGRAGSGGGAPGERTGLTGPALPATTAD